MIPSKVHFVWIGSRLEWVHVWAIRSAALHSNCDEIFLHHVDALEDTAQLAALKVTPGVQLVRLDAIALMNQAGQELGMGQKLAEVYRSVNSAVALSNMLRAALLYVHGGVYLDLDTVTVKSLLPLLEVSEFIGHEHIVWPYYVHRSVLLRAKSLVLSGARSLLRRLPRGYAGFRRVSKYYYLAVNGAILGCVPQGTLMAQYLHAMANVSPARYQVKHALGTHLLQQVVDDYDQTHLTIFPPDVFYPMPPEISEHWFRIQSDVALDDVLQPDTRVVHWYASVRTKHLATRITPEYISHHHRSQLFSALVRKYAI
ncbi:MAG: glycosyl transferase [Myxococcales bacterium]|nr:glycosyl transferase [Myxococcales bacterium]